MGHLLYYFQYSNNIVDVEIESELEDSALDKTIGIRKRFKRNIIR